MTSVFSVEPHKSYLEQKCFLGDPVTIARYDRQKYPFFERLVVQQQGFFWLPTEFDLTKDKSDFRSLTPHEQHIFSSNLKRQIVLDSVQGRAPSMVLLPICSLSELENWIQVWSFFETIHSRAYTHVIRNVYHDPSVVFDEIETIPEVMDCARDISVAYDELTDALTLRSPSDKERYLKKKLWRCLMSINALEGLRFFASFACSWAFAENKRMEGNAKIIRYICRDENTHLAGTQQLLKVMAAEDPEMAEIRDAMRDECVELYRSVVDQEKAWADYLFAGGSMVGLTSDLLKRYVEWLANKRMAAIGLPQLYKTGANPLPWTQRWISGAEVQVAPQESELDAYVVGAVLQDVTAETLRGMSL